MRFATILLLSVVLVVAMGVALEDTENEVTCSCAVFGQKGDNEISGVPIISHVVKIEGECDDNGARECRLFCKELGEEKAANENQDLCRALFDTDNPLRPSTYSKVCDAKMWTYAGLTSSRDYCCIEGKHDTCEFRM